MTNNNQIGSIKIKVPIKLNDDQIVSLAQSAMQVLASRLEELHNHIVDLDYEVLVEQGDSGTSVFAAKLSIGETADNSLGDDTYPRRTRTFRRRQVE